MTGACRSRCALSPPLSATVGYTVTVTPGSNGVILENVVAPVGDGGRCLAAADCTTTHSTPEVLGEEVVRPKPKPRTPLVLGEQLPATGAADRSTLFGVTGASAIALGGCLLLWERRRRTERG